MQSVQFLLFLIWLATGALLGLILCLEMLNLCRKMRQLWWRLLFRLIQKFFPITSEIRHYEVREVPSLEVLRMRALLAKTKGKWR